MTKNDIALIKRARYETRMNYVWIESLICKADTEEAREELRCLADEAFFCRERTACEFYN